MIWPGLGLGLSMGDMRDLWHALALPRGRPSRPRGMSSPSTGPFSGYTRDTATRLVLLGHYPLP